MTAPSVKPRLTARYRRTVVENDDYAAFTRRVLAAHGRRIARGDIEGLTTLAALALDIDLALTTAMRGLHTVGYSWADIAARLGITRQAAHQRWARDLDRDTR
jgi:hypothetical protein